MKIYTRQENLAWFAGLTTSLKEDQFIKAKIRHPFMPADITPGERNHEAWFGQFMELIGRPET